LGAVGACAGRVTASAAATGSSEKRDLIA
jgi:hypothetical protein